MIDFFDLDMSAKPVFFQKKKGIFSEMQNVLEVTSRTAKGAPNATSCSKVAKHNQDRSSTWSCLLYGYSVTRLLSSSCCSSLEIICNHHIL